MGWSEGLWGGAWGKMGAGGGRLWGEVGAMGGVLPLGSPLCWGLWGV